VQQILLTVYEGFISGEPLNLILDVASHQKSALVKVRQWEICHFTSRMLSALHASERRTNLTCEKFCSDKKFHFRFIL
jgi:hypothetical protein